MGIDDGVVAAYVPLVAFTADYEGMRPSQFMTEFIADRADHRRQDALTVEFVMLRQAGADSFGFNRTLFSGAKPRQLYSLGRKP